MVKIFCQFFGSGGLNNFMNKKSINSKLIKLQSKRAINFSNNLTEEISWVFIDFINKYVKSTVFNNYCEPYKKRINV